MAKNTQQQQSRCCFTPFEETTHALQRLFIKCNVSDINGRRSTGRDAFSLPRVDHFHDDNFAGAREINRERFRRFVLFAFKHVKIRNRRLENSCVDGVASHNTAKTIHLIGRKEEERERERERERKREREREEKVKIRTEQLIINLTKKFDKRRVPSQETYLVCLLDLLLSLTQP